MYCIFGFRTNEYMPLSFKNATLSAWQHVRHGTFLNALAHFSCVMHDAANKVFYKDFNRSKKFFPIYVQRTKPFFSG